jgi:hypothetical protein
MQDMSKNLLKWDSVNDNDISTMNLQAIIRKNSFITISICSVIGLIYYFGFKTILVKKKLI